MLQVGLKTVVAQRLLALLGIVSEELLKLGIRLDLATILRVLKVVLGDVLADVLSYLYP